MLTLQEVFDHVANHLLTQGRQSRSLTGNPCSPCQYRLYDDGQMLKCVAGACINDEDYSRDMEGMSVSMSQVWTAIQKFTGWDHLPRSVIGENSLFPEAALMINLQYAHDAAFSWDFINSVGENLSVVAAKFSLTFDPTSFKVNV